MPRVDPVPSDEAADQVADLLSRYEAEHDKRPVLWEVLANYPPLLDAHAEFYASTVLQGALDQELKELVGVAVSHENDCAFCVSSHRSNLVAMFGYEGETVEAIADGETDDLDLSPRTCAALAFARRAATDPTRVTDDHVEALRRVGFDDGEIVELVGAVAQFVAANVYADALAIAPGEYDGYGE